MYGASRPASATPRAPSPRLTSAVEGGFTVPEGLAHPWLAPLRADPAFALLVERAEASRREAETSFREAGGPALLGA